MIFECITPPPKQVRRFQTDEQVDDSLILKSGRIPNDAYVRRLNEIFLSQRKALEPDSPVITPSESEESNIEDKLFEKVEEEPDSESQVGGSVVKDSKVSGQRGISGTTKDVPFKSTQKKKENESLEADLLSGLEVGSDESDHGDVRCSIFKICWNNNFEMFITPDLDSSYLFHFGLS